MHGAEIQTTFYNKTFATVNAKSCACLLLESRAATRGTTGQLLPLNCSKTYLVVGCNINLQSFCSPRKYNLLVAALLESVDTRGTIHGDAQIMSYSTLSLLPDFVFMTT